MKLMYCIDALYNSGGMEKVLIDKVNYLSNYYNYEIMIVTIEQKNRKIFFRIDEKIKHQDLNINYSEDINKFFLLRILKYLKKNNFHKKKLKNLIDEFNPDIIISLGGKEAFFLPNIIKKNSIKLVRENHFNKNVHFLRDNKNLYLKLKSYYMNIMEKNSINKYDEFIVLTEEDKKLWNNSKIKVIPNSIKVNGNIKVNYNNKKVISIGRLEYQKGYDILIDIWKNIVKDFPEWKLEIYGEGTEKEKLLLKIKKFNLSNKIILKGITYNIEKAYLESSIYIMTSRYEGLPMVLLEASSYGLPLISFACPCGPKDIIKNGENGFLIEKNNIELISNKLKQLMRDFSLRKKMGIKGNKIIKKYDQKNVMQEWHNLFNNLKEGKEKNDNFI